MTDSLSVPVALHLDHCPEREVISACLAKGWNSVLFDGSKLTVEENKRQCIEVVAEARRYGALVEGEIEGFKRVEDMADDERVNEQVARDGGRLHQGDRRRRLRPGDRQRPRHVQDRARRSTPSGSPTSSRRPASRSRSTAARA